MQQLFNDRVKHEINTPFLMVLGGEDTIIDNQAAKDFFNECAVQDKDLIVYDACDHNPIYDNEYMPMITNDLIGWFNTHC